MTAERRVGGRRKQDDEALNMATEAKGLIDQHIQECAKNYTESKLSIDELRAIVAPIAQWFAARTKREEAWGRIVEKLTEKLLERFITFVVIALAMAAGSTAALKHLL